MCKIKSAVIRLQIPTDLVAAIEIADTGIIISKDITISKSTAINRYIKHYNLRNGNIFTVGASDTTIFRSSIIFEN